MRSLFSGIVRRDFDRLTFLHKGPLRENSYTSSTEPICYKGYNILVTGYITLPGEGQLSAKQVLDLYLKQGDSFPMKVDGVYLLIISRQGMLKIFNNFYQGESCYYYLDKSVLVFADSLKGLLSCPGVKKDLDLNFIPSFLKTGYSHTEKTAFRHIFRLLPTCQIHVDRGRVSVRSLWKKEYRTLRRTKALQDVDTYESLFRKGLADHLLATRPREVGILLSGGQDTSYTFIQASKIFAKPIHAFTACFDKWGFDEYPKAKYITDRFGGIGHRIIIGSKDLDLVPEIVSEVEEPVSGSSLPIHACAKAAAGHVDTMLTGDGGDTLFAEFYPVAEWHKYLRHLPVPAISVMHKMIKGLRSVSDWERAWELEHVLKLFSRRSRYEDFYDRLCCYRHFGRDQLKGILDPGFQNTISTNDCMIDIPFTRNNFYWALIEAKLLYGVYLYMNLVTRKSVEGAGMSYYTPYLNRELISFITGLPEDWVNTGSTIQKLSNEGVKRRFHKEAMLRYLPRRFVFGSQQSLDVPWSVLFGERPAITQRLCSRLKRRGWFSSAGLDVLFSEFGEQRQKPQELYELKNHGYRIYSLLTLELWCMQYIDGMKPSAQIPLEQYLK